MAASAAAFDDDEIVESATNKFRKWRCAAAAATNERLLMLCCGRRDRARAAEEGEADDAPLRAGVTSSDPPGGLGPDAAAIADAESHPARCKPTLAGIVSALPLTTAALVVGVVLVAVGRSLERANWPYEVPSLYQLGLCCAHFRLDETGMKRCASYVGRDDGQHALCPRDNATGTAQQYILESHRVRSSAAHTWTPVVYAPPGVSVDLVLSVSSSHGKPLLSRARASAQTTPIEPLDPQELLVEHSSIRSVYGDYGAVRRLAEPPADPSARQLLKAGGGGATSIGGLAGRAGLAAGGSIWTANSYHMAPPGSARYYFYGGGLLYHRSYRSRRRPPPAHPFASRQCEGEYSDEDQQLRGVELPVFAPSRAAVLARGGYDPRRTLGSFFEPHYYRDAARLAIGATADLGSVFRRQHLSADRSRDGWQESTRLAQPLERVQLSALSFQLPTERSAYPLTLTVHSALVSGDGAQYQPLGEWCDPVYVLLTLAERASARQLDRYGAGAGVWLVGSLLCALALLGVVARHACFVVLRSEAHARRFRRTVLAIRALLGACALAGTAIGILHIGELDLWVLIPWLFLGMLIAFTPALVVSLSGGWRSEGPNLLRWRALQLLVIVAFVAMFIFIGCVLFPVQVRPPILVIHWLFFAGGALLVILPVAVFVWPSQQQGLALARQLSRSPTRLARQLSGRTKRQPGDAVPPDDDEEEDGSFSTPGQSRHRARFSRLGAHVVLTVGVFTVLLCAISLDYTTASVHRTQLWLWLGALAAGASCVASSGRAFVSDMLPEHVETPEPQVGEASDAPAGADGAAAPVTTPVRQRLP